jgi:hypothetical protein
MPGAFSDKDIKSIPQEKSMFTLRETLIAAEKDRLNGRPDYTVEEVAAAKTSHRIDNGRVFVII